MKNTTKNKEQSLLHVMKFVFQITITLLIISCNNVEKPPTESCDYKNFIGKYLFYSETDTSTHKIEIESLNENNFKTNGIYGNGFWFPIAPLSGVINDCKIIIDQYQNIEREGLPSPGGIKRYYYESMSGYGEYYEDKDSIKLFITYERTGDFTEYFSDEIFLIKVE